MTTVYVYYSEILESDSMASARELYIIRFIKTLIICKNTETLALTFAGLVTNCCSQQYLQ